MFGTSLLSKTGSPFFSNQARDFWQSRRSLSVFALTSDLAPPLPTYHEKWTARRMLQRDLKNHETHKLHEIKDGQKGESADVLARNPVSGFIAIGSASP